MAGSPPGGQSPTGNRSPPAVGRRSPPEVLRFLARSDARRRILLALAADGPATRRALAAATSVPRSTLYRILGELDDRGLVARAGAEGEGEGVNQQGDEGVQVEAEERYAPTPTGAFLADRLRSVVDTVEVTRLLQALAGQAHRADRAHLADEDGTGDAEDGSPSQSGVEVLVASAGDPRAPARRLADRLAAASRVRLLVPADGRVALEAALGARPEGDRSIEAVVAAELVESAAADASTTRTLRAVVAAPDVALAVADADVPLVADADVPVVAGVDVPAVAGVADETAFAAVPDGPGSDGTGRIRGYVETEDAALRVGVERAYAVAASGASALDSGAVGPPGVDGP